MNFSFILSYSIVFLPNTDESYSIIKFSFLSDNKLCIIFTSLFKLLTISILFIIILVPYCVNCSFKVSIYIISTLFEFVFLR